MKKLLLTLFCLLAVGASQAWADYTIKFLTGSTTSASTSTTASNWVESGENGTDYVSSVSITASMTPKASSNGVKFGNSSKGGDITLNLSSKGKVKATKITANVTIFKDSEKSTFTLSVNGNSTLEKKVSNVTTGAVSLEIPEGVELSTIKLTSSARMYASSVEVKGAAGSSTPVAPIWKEVPSELYTNIEYDFYEYVNLGTYSKSEVSIAADGTALTDGKGSFTTAGNHTITASYTDKTTNETVSLDAKTINFIEKVLDAIHESSFVFNTGVSYPNMSNSTNINTVGTVNDDYATISFNKGTNNSYYYPSTGNSKYLRIYDGASITFSATSGYFIESVTITAKSNLTYLNGSDVTASGSGTDRTYTPNSNLSSFTLNCSSTASSSRPDIYTITVKVKKAVAADPKWTVTREEVNTFVYMDQFDPKSLLRNVENGVPFVFVLKYNDADVIEAKADGTYILPKAGDYMLYVSSNEATGFNAKGQEIIILTVGKADTSIAFSAAEKTVSILDDPATVQFPTLTNKFNAPVKWSVVDDNLDATAEYVEINAETGVISKFLKAGEVFVSATVAESENLKGSDDLYTLTITNDITAPVATPAPAEGALTMKVGETLEVSSQPNTKLVVTCDDTTVETESNEWALTPEATGVHTYSIVSKYNSAESAPLAFTLTVEKADANIFWSATAAEATIGSENNKFPTLSNPRNLEVVYSAEGKTDNGEDVASIANDGTITLLAHGTATITATFGGNDLYNEAAVSYTLKVIDPEKLPPYSKYDFSDANNFVTGTDFTHASTSSDGQKKVAASFSDSYATVNLDHKTASSTANIYWYKDGESLRMYQAGQLTITPNAGYAVKSVVFNFASKNDVSIIDPGTTTAVTGVETHTYTLKSVSTDPVAFTFGKATQIKDMTINYVYVAGLNVPSNELSVAWGAPVEFEFASERAIQDGAVEVVISYVPSANSEDTRVPSEADLTEWYTNHAEATNSVASYDDMLAFANEYLASNPNCDAWVNDERQPSATIGEDGNLIINAPASGKYHVSLKTKDSFADRYAPETSSEFTVNVLPSLDGLKINWVELDPAAPGENQTITILKPDEPQTIHVDIDIMFATLLWKFTPTPTTTIPTERPSLRVAPADGDYSDWNKYGSDEIKVNGPGELELAVSKNGQTTYLGTFNVVETTNKDAVTGIDSIESADEVAARWFTLDGVEVAADSLAPGLYIRVAGGEAVKVIVK